MARRPAPEVEVEQGRLAGRWAAKGEVAVFRGVPFAAAPVGDLRWRPPQPATPWTGVRKATKSGPAAIQREVDLELFLHALVSRHGWSAARARAMEALLKRVPRPEQSEDCLHLTVRTPSPDPTAKLPVMVWIHGGDHQDGSSSEIFYESNALAHHGVVTVAINYRLGVMGYFAHPELTAESEHGVAGNYGTLDQIAALEWVGDNIAAFGGDPGNVTIFGESAGGESVMHMMTSPLARGLFHRAIPQSPANGGQMIHLDRPFLAHESALDQGLRFADALGVTGDGQLPRLRAKTPDQLYALARASRKLGCQYPVIDGHVLPESPFAAFAGGRQAPVPLLIGSNADEGSIIQVLFEAPMADYRFRPIPDDRLQPEIAADFGDDVDRLLAHYPGLDRRDPAAEEEFGGDQLFGGPVYHYVHHHRRAGHPAYLYLFARTPPSPKQTIGAYHAAELVFVHGTRVAPVLPMTDDDQALSAEMMRYWTDFAKTGDPNAGDPSASHPEWPPFDESDPTWMRFDHEIAATPVDRRDRYDIFTARIDRLVDQMTSTPA
jgi:para-nitrobenzyl esterase